MLIAVREHGVGLSSDGRAYAIDRFGHALTVVGTHVRRVMVYLTDENGPRGGRDKKCLVTVDLNTGRPVTVEARGESVSGAVDGAAGRVREAVRAVLRKRHDLRRRTGKLTKLFRGLFRRDRRDG